MNENLIFTVNQADNTYEDYLKDESRVTGYADSISFPTQISEIIDVVKHVTSQKKKITIQGSRTGICAGAVPTGGHVINLSKMNKITGMRYSEETDDYFVSVEAGVTLEELNTYIRLQLFDEARFYACNPTELTATIGGMAACNAAGPLAYKYGDMRDNIEKLTVVLSSGDVLELTRGENPIRQGKCEIPINNKSISIEMSNNITSFGNIEDAIDLFIPSDGTLGIITNIEIRLSKLPEEIWGVLGFFKKDEDAVRFALKLKAIMLGPIQIAELEYFDINTLKLVEELKTKVSSLQKIPNIDLSCACAIYVRLEGDDIDEMEQTLENIIELLDITGSDSETAWAVNEESELERIRLFRHAVPEAVNDKIDFYKLQDSKVHKLSTDMSIDDIPHLELLKMYRDDLRKQELNGVIFGHLLKGHLHINIIPENAQQLEIANKLLDQWAQYIGSRGGHICTEHGVGKLKRERLQNNAPKESFQNLKKVKQAFDPVWTMGNGNIYIGADKE